MSSKTQTVIWVNKNKILSHHLLILVHYPAYSSKPLIQHRNVLEMIDAMYILLTKLQRKDMDNCW